MMNEIVKKIVSGVNFKEFDVMTYGKLCKALDIVQLDTDIKQAVFVEYVKSICGLPEEFELNYEAARNRIYGLRHPGHFSFRGKRYAKEHPEVIKANSIRNKDKIRERNRWRYNNEEEFRKKSIERNRRWRQKNREKYNAYHREYCKKQKEMMCNE